MSFMNLTIENCLKKAEERMFYAEKYSEMYPSDPMRSIRESLIANNLLRMAEQLRLDKQNV